VITFEQFSLDSGIAIARGKIQSQPSRSTELCHQPFKVGMILMKEWPGMPELPGLETEPCFGEWSLVKALDGVALDREIHVAGWNLFFMATEVKVMFLGSLAAKIQRALKRILAKVKQKHFNGLEVTPIAACKRSRIFVQSVSSKAVT
jgi:hypothetical protein